MAKYVKEVTEFNRQQLDNASSDQLAEISRWVNANPDADEDTQALRLMLIDNRAMQIFLIRKRRY